MKKRNVFVFVLIALSALLLYGFLSLPDINELIYNESLEMQVKDSLERPALAPGDENWTIIHWPDSQGSASNEGLLC